MPRDAVSRTANVERTARHKWVNCALIVRLIYALIEIICLRVFITNYLNLLELYPAFVCFYLRSIDS